MNCLYIISKIIKKNFNIIANKLYKYFYKNFLVK